MLKIRKNWFTEMIQYLLAFIWGFAEATFFFLIPDIYLTWIAIKNPRKALIACFVAVFAACLGGSLMYWFAFSNPNQASSFLTYIPAIYPKLIARVNHDVLMHPFYELFIAPFKGIPYKIYAVAMGANKLDFSTFIIVSFFARLFRFLLITTAGIFIASILKIYLKEKKIYYIHIIIWFLVYSLYFTTVFYYYK